MYRFSVFSTVCAAVWRCSGLTDPETARRYFAATEGVPLDTVGIGHRIEV